ncbi:758_t:CDS:2 [Ambispora gerdemannii]|uniref:histone acetyltransferase n=1 Tax=Ambispora gerdemannii TaxID=144530 RepID=A0A9N8V3C3_9GLOM|nr:758_t:CDS:2 [Ambispora gerdemannii]
MSSGKKIRIKLQRPSYPPADKPLNTLTIHEKLMKVGRYMPCSPKVPTSSNGQCDCVGWKPNPAGSNRADSCSCGHRLSSHGGNQDEDFSRRLDIAMKIDKYLEDKNKLLDFSYEDEEVKRLRGQMTNNKLKEESEEENTELVEYPEGLPSDLEFRCITNDNTRENLILLTNLKKVFATQLPNMPKHYIARLTYDTAHYSVVLIRPIDTGNKMPKVIGGITYRPFPEQKFAEIVFCAIDAQEQVRGHGSRLMNYFKDYIRATSDIQHFMTYADDLAVGFFKKNGFTTEIDLDPAVWVGYIKDYTGGTLMQCSMLPRIKYVHVKKILESQRQAIKKKLEERYISAKVYPGLQQLKEGAQNIDPMEVPGIKESGWTAQMEDQAKQTKHLPHYPVMVTVLQALRNHRYAWPFQEPVNAEIVPDYYHIIKNPMDLQTLKQNMENDKYPTIIEFSNDAQRIFDNARQYNSPSTVYVKAADELEEFFWNKLYEEGVRLV